MGEDGGPVVDSQGQLWDGDLTTIGAGFGVDCGAPNPIANTQDDAIYCSNRWFAPWNSANGPYLKTIAVEENGLYTVRLHFAELVSCWLPFAFVFC